MILTRHTSAPNMWQNILIKYQHESAAAAHRASLSQHDCDHATTTMSGVCEECGTVVERRFEMSDHFNGTTQTSNVRKRSAICTVYTKIPDNVPVEIRALAVDIFKMATNGRIFRGAMRMGIIAASVHRASIVLRVPISFDELLTLFSVPTRILNKSIALVSDALGVGQDASRFEIPVLPNEIDIDDILHEIEAPSTARDFVGLLFEFARLQCEELFSKSFIKSVIAACIWCFVKLSRLPVSAKEIGLLCGVATTTVQRKHVSLKKHIVRLLMKQIFSAQLTETYGHTSRTLKATLATGAPISVLNHADPKSIAVVDDRDGFVYPIEDVDDILEWNLMLTALSLKIKVVTTTADADVVDAVLNKTIVDEAMVCKLLMTIVQ